MIYELCGYLEQPVARPCNFSRISGTPTRQPNVSERRESVAALLNRVQFGNHSLVSSGPGDLWGRQSAWRPDHGSQTGGGLKSLKLLNQIQCCRARLVTTTRRLRTSLIRRPRDCSPRAASPAPNCSRAVRGITSRRSGVLSKRFSRLPLRPDLAYRRLAASPRSPSPVLLSVHKWQESWAFLLGNPGNPVFGTTGKCRFRLRPEIRNNGERIGQKTAS